MDGGEGLPVCIFFDMARPSEKYFELISVLGWKISWKWLLLRVKLTTNIFKSYMDIQGKWALEWGTDGGLIEGGFIEFNSGIISGGNSIYSYSGMYQTLSEFSIQGSIKVTSIKKSITGPFSDKLEYRVYLKGDFGIADASPPKRALMVIDSHFDGAPAKLIRLICEK